MACGARRGAKFWCHVLSNQMEAARGRRFNHFVVPCLWSFAPVCEGGITQDTEISLLQDLGVSHPAQANPSHVTKPSVPGLTF